MVWQFSPYFPLFIVAAVISIAVAGVTMGRRSAPGSTALGAVNIAGAIWALTAGLQIASGTLAYVTTFHKLSFLGMNTLGIALFAFAATYTGRARWVTAPRLAALSLLPIVTQILTWTSGHQTLMWKSLGIDTVGSLAVLRETPGPWWWIDTAYTYLLVGIAVVLFAILFVREPGLHRRQASAILAAVVVPMAADIVYVYGLAGPDATNVTPALFTWVGLSLYWGFTRYRLLDVTPTAREYVVGHMSDSVIVTDAKDRAVYLNPSAEKLTGMELRLCSGKPVVDVMAACPGLPAEELTRAGNPTEGLREYEHAGRFYDGQISVLRDKKGRSSGTILVLRDITRRRLAELALAEAHRGLEDRVRAATAELRAANTKLSESRTRLAHLLSSSPAVIYCREPREPFAITFVGHNLESQLGYTPGQLVGNADFWAERLHPEDRYLLAGLGEAVEKEEASYEYRLLVEDGTHRWIHDRVRLVRDARGRPTELIGSWLDVTERRAMEEQLRQSSKMEAVGVLAGGIAHDFNNLLTAMGGYAELVQERLSDDLSSQYLGEVSRAIARAAGLTRQLLAFSRKQVLRPQVISLNTVIRSTEEMFGRLIGEHIEFRTDLAPDLGPVRADPGQIEQVCMNLIVNARDAMPRGGRLVVKTENADLTTPVTGAFADVPLGSYVVLSVADTGHGIPEDVLPHVFEPFFTTKASGGTGLGLATVYGIAGQSGGRVTVESRVDQGTTFRLWLPRLDGQFAQENPVTATPAGPLGGTGSLLVVEDEDGVRSLVAKALRHQGFKTLEADGAEAALEVIRENGAPDLLITDVVMRTLSGPDLAKHLRETYPELPVLFISGYARDKLEASLDGPDIHFLEKPFSMNSLAGAVRAALSRNSG